MANDYLGLPRIVSIILAIFPFTAWLFGIIARIQDKKYVAAILRIFFGGWLLWLIDLVLCIIKGCNVNILRAIDC